MSGNETTETKIVNNNQILVPRWQLCGVHKPEAKVWSDLLSQMKFNETAAQIQVLTWLNVTNAPGQAQYQELVQVYSELKVPTEKIPSRRVATLSFHLHSCQCHQELRFSRHNVFAFGWLSFFRATVEHNRPELELSTVVWKTKQNQPTKQTSKQKRRLSRDPCQDHWDDA